MEERAPSPVQPDETPGAPSFSFFWMCYFLGLNSREAEFMQ